jgi:class 3 adenylate cyclase
LADDAQILVDPVVTEQVKDRIALASVGRRLIKGYDHALEVFAVVHGDASIRPVGRRLRPVSVGA